MRKSRVLVIDDEPEVCNTIANILSTKKGGYEVEVAFNAMDGIKIAENKQFDHILCDIFMKPDDGLCFLELAKTNRINANIIMMSGMADIDLAMKSLKLGAKDYIHKPVTSEQLLFQLKRAEEEVRLKKENLLLRSEIKKKYSYNNIVAKSSNMQKLFNIIDKIADYKTTVLITGESGTGKELVAKAIHYNSSRGVAPFIPVNCGGIPENLLESEFFGHIKGAFTDAIKSKKGLFEEAHEGTLFLDEIGELPLNLQVKLLRVLQEEEIRPVGDNRSIQVDVRIIAATSKNLTQEVKKGQFREDLFYRINVLHIDIPPLRERNEDIPLLVEHFIEKYNKRLKTAIESVSPEVMHAFMDYDWPGNVRELENIMERAMVMTEKKIIMLDEIPLHISSAINFPRDISSFQIDETELSIKKCSQKLEKDLIKRAILKTSGKKSQAAQILEISLPALLYKMKNYGINQHDKSNPA